MPSRPGRAPSRHRRCPAPPRAAALGKRYLNVRAERARGRGAERSCGALPGLPCACPGSAPLHGPPPARPTAGLLLLLLCLLLLLRAAALRLGALLIAAGRSSLLFVFCFFFLILTVVIFSSPPAAGWLCTQELRSVGWRGAARCAARWGRRRPFLDFGSFALAFFSEGGVRLVAAPGAEISHREIFFC